MKTKRQLILILCFALAFILTSCSSIEVGTESVDLKVGESTQLDVTTSDTPITYESADSSIATVDESGTVTAVGVGTTSITMTNSKGKTAECSINVSHVQPTAINLSQTELTITPDQAITLEATFTPENTSDRALVYSIDQTNIATVDGSGTVTGVSEGTATLAVKSANGVTATCAITVLPYADSISIESALELKHKETGTLTVTFAPENCVPEEIIWTSSDDSVAKVENGKVTAVGVGTATITAETAQTNLTASCAVAVEYAELTITSFNSGGYSSTSTSSVGIGGWTSSSTYKTIGFKPKATASGGSGDYQYKFDIIKNGSIVKTSGWQSGSSSEFTFSSGGTYTARVTVRDSIGQTATASETVTAS